MSSVSSFIRQSELQLQKNRHKNLEFVSDQYGHGFQALLVQLTKQISLFISPSEASNLVNASKYSEGSQRSVFTFEKARQIERALDFPMCCLDLPDWHFQKNIDAFWQYAERASTDRVWFDKLLHILLEIPDHEPIKTHPATGAKPIGIPKDRLNAIRARLQSKQTSTGDLPAS